MKEAANKANPANLAKKDDMMGDMAAADPPAAEGMWAHKLDTKSVWFLRN